MGITPKKKIKSLILLHLILMIYSLSGIFSKMAAQESFLSLKFCVFYGAVILLLVFYAFFWQQIIKRLPLTTAFANKAITVVWGLVWGMIFFGEHLTVGKVLGVSLVVAGVVIFALSDKEVSEE
ncbi:Multidrug transporter EmrE [Lachnospiraceae bacterium]|nr:Multidrug transporter EmrE [Lachnospiraceae bacterium]